MQCWSSTTYGITKNAAAKGLAVDCSGLAVGGCSEFASQSETDDRHPGSGQGTKRKMGRTLSGSHPQDRADRLSAEDPARLSSEGFRASERSPRRKKPAAIIPLRCAYQGSIVPRPPRPQNDLHLDTLHYAVRAPLSVLFGGVCSSGMRHPGAFRGHRHSRRRAPPRPGSLPRGRVKFAPHPRNPKISFRDFPCKVARFLLLLHAEQYYTKQYLFQPARFR